MSVHSTHIASKHTFSKTYTPSITLIASQGVQGDIHAGTTTQHKSSKSSSSGKSPNLRQVHLLSYELFHSLAADGFTIQPGELGENITTYGIDLLSLAKDSYLYFGAGEDCAVVQVTGLRNPGPGVEKHKTGLLERVKYKGPDGRTVRRLGIMGVVIKGGVVNSGDIIKVIEPEERFALEPV
jgi:MOSC domain-containing protein YiiM